MKFNEKLIELRKKSGLSQEELGYKLNVSRQTVSKWELGQTTPELEKIIQLSKIFNVSTDELINDTPSNSYTDSAQNNGNQSSTYNSSNKKPKNIKFFIIGGIVVIIVLFILKLFALFPALGIFQKVNEQVDNSRNTQNSVFEFIMDVFKEILGTVKSNNDSDFNNEMKNMTDTITSFDTDSYLNYTNSQDITNMFGNAFNN